MRPPTRTATLLAVVLLLAAGCGDDEPAADPGGTAASEAPATSAPPTADAPSSTAPTPRESTSPSSTYAGVTPADGPAVTSGFVTLHAPRGWYEPKGTSPLIRTTSLPGDPSNIMTLNVLETPLPDSSTDALARSNLEVSIIDPPLERQPDVVVAGQPAYHLAGPDSTFLAHADEYGLYYQGTRIEVSIKLADTLSQAEREAITASIMASLTLTG